MSLRRNSERNVHLAENGSEGGENSLVKSKKALKVRIVLSRSHAHIMKWLGRERWESFSLEARQSGKSANKGRERLLFEVALRGCSLDIVLS